MLSVTHGEVQWLEGSAPAAFAPQVSPDGRWLAAGCVLATEVAVWDLRSGALATRVPATAHTRPVFAADGTLTLAMQGTAARPRAGVVAGSEEAVLRPGYQDPRVLRPDRASSSSSSDSGAWSSTEGDWSLLLEFPVMCRGNLYFPHFAQDGRHLLAASAPNDAQVWDWAEVRWTLRELGVDWAPEQPLPARSRPKRAAVRLLFPD